MKLLEDRILKCGRVLPGDILKVDSFVNHQIDVPFMCRLADEFKKLYKSSKITKILTVEASGIGMACLVAERFGVPAVFAKKSKSANVDGEFYSAEVVSYTHGNTNNVIVSKDYLSADDTVLIIDDFLATGNALIGLISLCEQAGAKVAGCGIIVEKAYQPGGDLVRKKCRVESLARIASLDPEKGITFI